MENGTSVPGKPHVFIGSSAEGLEIAQYLQASLEEHRTLEALTWNQGFFAPTLGHLENLEKGAEEKSSKPRRVRIHGSRLHQRCARQAQANTVADSETE